MHEEFKQQAAKLLKYMMGRLNLQSPPSKLILKKNEENAQKPWGYTGNYDPETKEINLFITDRHRGDILRSFAHELIHHWQNERGTLHPKSKDSKLPTKYETKPSYAQNDPWLRKREIEAFMLGGLLFRDFQDENRHGTPLIPPFIPEPYD